MKRVINELVPVLLVCTLFLLSCSNNGPGFITTSQQSVYSSSEESEEGDISSLDKITILEHQSYPNAEVKETNQSETIECSEEMSIEFEPSPFGSGESQTDMSYSTENPSGTTENSDELPIIRLDERPEENATYAFATAEDLYAALQGKDDERLLYYDKEEHNYGLLYNAFLDEYQNKENIENCIPFLNGEAMPIKGIAEWQQIVLFTCELYDLPWIWFYCDYNDRCVVVGMSRVDWLEKAGFDTSKSIDEMIRELSPHAPLPDNKSEFAESYSDIYKTSLTINSSTVDAIVFKFKNGRTHYRFFYRGSIMSIWAYDGEELTNDFWGAFDISF